MAERGITVDHSTLHRWVIREVPLLDKRSTVINGPWDTGGGWMKLHQSQGQRKYRKRHI